jgi:hypothetical protein
MCSLPDPTYNTMCYIVNLQYESYIYSFIIILGVLFWASVYFIEHLKVRYNN